MEYINWFKKCSEYLNIFIFPRENTLMLKLLLAIHIATLLHLFILMNQLILTANAHYTQF